MVWKFVPPPCANSSNWTSSIISLPMSVNTAPVTPAPIASAASRICRAGHPATARQQRALCRPAGSSPLCRSHRPSGQSGAAGLLCPGPAGHPRVCGGQTGGGRPGAVCRRFQGGEVMLNGHDYHAGPTAFIFDNGARQLGAPVVPCGPHDTQRQLEALLRYQPTGYVGPLVTLLDLLEAAEAAELPSDSLRRALLCEATHPETAPLRAIHGIAASTVWCGRMWGWWPTRVSPVRALSSTRAASSKSSIPPAAIPLVAMKRAAGGDSARSGVSAAAASHRLARALARQAERLRAHQPAPQAGVADQVNAYMQTGSIRLPVLSLNWKENI